MLSEKYIAGFLDSDGCIFINWKKGKYKPLLCLSFSQKTSQDKVLYLIQEAIGGYIHCHCVKGNSYSELKLNGKDSQKALYRIKKYLVIKRHYAESCLHVIKQETGWDNWQEIRIWLKQQRRVLSLPLPNYPSRKWLAGYVDGDGCFHARVPKSRTSKSCRISMEIASSEYDREGLDILHKAFNGIIHKHNKRNESGVTIRYMLDLVPSKAKKVLGHFAKYLVTKKDQANFILGCAEMGNYHDGETIKATLKQLKTRGHRLNEPEADIRNLLSYVKKKEWSWHGETYQHCVKCKTKDIPHYAKGLCKECYTEKYNEGRRKFQLMPKSELVV